MQNREVAIASAEMEVDDVNVAAQLEMDDEGDAWKWTARLQKRWAGVGTQKGKSRTIYCTANTPIDAKGRKTKGVSDEERNNLYYMRANYTTAENGVMHS